MNVHVSVGNFEQGDQISSVCLDLELGCAIAFCLDPPNRVDHLALRTQRVKDERGDGVRLRVWLPVERFPVQPLYLLANVSVHGGKQAADCLSDGLRAERIQRAHTFSVTRYSR